ncbi:hypothetical protein W97_02900 [Coniosporium apollinis CBS 100218]|uniref:Tyrosine specific protein phosphatases domain-containing protein n=1 Tax=Coniosporium apollinis (strain CBS 100218) TaxID=1168221 RepID=R7YP52_CONA1|nr:uncharacterized protein W97_02900 [Coniosporium apollinis CBS 100218]EON63672.1 hypothetical protein W97_02900 [Coniosporium apollinis CBS 100218]
MDISHQYRAIPDRSPSVIQSETYTYRVPTPPRIILPPPLTEHTLLPKFPPVPIRGHDDWPAGATDFTKHLDLHSLVSRGVMAEWTYVKRREAQQILPFLYLGPVYPAKDRDFLRAEGITMVLLLQSGSNMRGAIKTADALGIAKKIIDIRDVQDLIPSFPRATRLINEHVALTPGNAKVLITCESGNERSAAVVAAYLMEMFQNVDHIVAMQLCQARRFCVNFDDALKMLLRSYHDILEAKRAVNGLSYTFADDISSHENGNDSHKRGVDEVWNEGMELDTAHENMDAARFDGNGYAPFRDA